MKMAPKRNINPLLTGASEGTKEAGLNRARSGCKTS
jgi:hypothetical protein